MTSGRTVLVVEDDPAIAQLLAHALGRRYRVHVVSDGADALASAVEMRPDLVLLDVSLPGIDGFTVAEAIKASDVLRRIPIIFLTASDRSMDVVRGINVGAKHYITKPFRLEDVVGKVQRLVPPLTSAGSA